MSLNQVEKLVQEYKAYANAITKKLIKDFSLPAESIDDFISAANFGLVEAATRYDASKNVEFKYYSYARIKGAIIDHIRKASSLSSQSYRLKQACLGEEHSFKNYQKHVERGALSEKVNLHEALIEIAKQEYKNPETILTKKQNSKKIINAMKKLSLQEKKVLYLYYYKDLSFEEIGKRMSGISKSWICRIHKKALVNLKNIIDAN